MAEAAAALPEAVELRRFQADPRRPVTGIELAFGVTGPAVYEYFDGEGRLFCFAADAVHGPQVTLNGAELTGGDPAGLEQWLAELPHSMSRLAFGPCGNPGSNELGLVLRVQETADGLVTRPILVGREWADRCCDDSEGRIPDCEWLGRQWPHPFLIEMGTTDSSSGIEPPRWAGRWAPPSPPAG